MTQTVAAFIASSFLSERAPVSGFMWLTTHTALVSFFYIYNARDLLPSLPVSQCDAESMLSGAANFGAGLDTLVQQCQFFCLSNFVVFSLNLYMLVTELS